MRLLYFLTVIIFLGCANRKEKKYSIALHLTQTEAGLKKLVDSFKLEFDTANTQRLKDSTDDKYNVKIFNYLTTSTIDSITVHVDSVITNNLTITTKFHTRENIAFQYGLTFQKPMTRYFDSLFNFMKGLKAGTDTTINFSYMGSHRLRYQNDTLLPALTIFAVPTFLRKAN